MTTFAPVGVGESKLFSREYRLTFVAVAELAAWGTMILVVLIFGHNLRSVWWPKTEGLSA